MNDRRSEQVIGAAFRVYNELGFGFLESIYEKALSIELSKLGMTYETQCPITVYYDEQIVGEFVCDLIVGGDLIVELKSVANLNATHEVQLVNYLTATGIDVGLLINFGPTKVSVKRKYRVFRR